MQTLGASGACHMGAKFLRLHYEPYKANNKSKMYIPAESWGKYDSDISISRFARLGIV